MAQVSDLENINPFRGGTDTPVLDFWWHLPWVSKAGWIPCFCVFLLVWFSNYTYLSTMTPIIGFRITWVRGLAPFKIPTSRAVTSTSLVSLCPAVEFSPGSSFNSLLAAWSFILYKISGSTGSGMYSSQFIVRTFCFTEELNEPFEFFHNSFVKFNEFIELGL